MMRSKFLAALGCFVAAAVLPAADHNVRADIPFGFSVAGRELPAGQYRLAVDVATHRVELAKADGVTFAALFMSNASPVIPNVRAELVFHRYGQSHYLREIRTSATNISMPVSPSEKFAKRASTGERGPKMALVRVAVR